MGTASLLAVVVLFFLLYILLGLAASWGRQHISEDYFLAGRNLPWFAVALSLAGAACRLETWLGMIGLVYAVGVAGTSLVWGNFLALTVLMWMFLPFFIRKKLYSPAEFLERRYSPSTRGLFCMLAIPALLLGVLAPALYVGGWALATVGFGTQFSGFSWAVVAGIAVIALATGAYCVSGGLTASVWAAVLQMLVIIAGGTLLAIVATHDAGGLREMLQKNGAARCDLLLPLKHASLPWPGVIAFWFTLAMWNAAASPASVQRCLGARSEWDAKLGAIVAGILQVLLAAVVVLPGLAAYAKLGAAGNTGLSFDQAAVRLIESLFGREGVLAALGQGLVLSAVLAAVMSTVSACVNAIAAMWTMDVLQDLLRRTVSEAELVGRGRLASIVTLVLGALLAPLVMFWDKGVLNLVLEIAAVVGPPVAVIMLMAFVWPRAHGRAAFTTLLLGAIAGGLLWITVTVGEVVPEWMYPVVNRAGVNFVVSLVLLILTTFIIPQNAGELYDPDTQWSLRWSRLPPHESTLGAGPRNLLFWWIVMIILSAAVWIVLK